MKKLTSIIILFFAPLFSVNAELCSTTSSLAVHASTPTARFTFETDGVVVTDNRTGLMWARCAWGYSWDVGSTSCVVDINVDSTMSWKDALKLVKGDTDYLGETGWRLPNVKELASIIEHKCLDAAINNEVFPGTESGVFWSNTHSALDGNAIMTVNFGAGEVNSVLASGDSYVRLVRDIPAP